MRKLMIIDDDEEIINLFVDTLKEYNYDVVGEKDGRKAIERIKEVKPDIVILDILLPYIHGFAICQKIKEDEEIKDTKVIFISAKSYESDIKKAYELGADFYFSKPFKWEEVLDKLEELTSEN